MEIYYKVLVLLELTKVAATVVVVVMVVLAFVVANDFLNIQVRKEIYCSPLGQLLMDRKFPNILVGMEIVYNLNIL